VFCVHVCLLYVWFLCVLFVHSVLWYCWLRLLTCKNRLPYNLNCVGRDVKHCSIQSNPTRHRWAVTLCARRSIRDIAGTRHGSVCRGWHVVGRHETVLCVAQQQVYNSCLIGFLQLYIVKLMQWCHSLTHTQSTLLVDTLRLVHWVMSCSLSPSRIICVFKQKLLQM